MEDDRVMQNEADLAAVRAVLWDYWLGSHNERCSGEWPHSGCPYPPPPEACVSWHAAPPEPNDRGGERRAHGITVADGREVALDHPFTHISVRDGAISLRGRGSYLLVPADARAVLGGIAAGLRRGLLDFPHVA